MLVLSRRRGESIIVGDDIEIRILEVHGSQVKIGVQAPAHHSVHRKEVYIAIHNGAQPLTGAPRPSSPPHRHSEGYGGGNGGNGGRSQPFHTPRWARSERAAQRRAGGGASPPAIGS